MSYTIRTIDELESIHHGAVKLAGAELGIRAFGMQVRDAASRRKLHPGADGVRVLAIGCAPGGAYERPEAFRSVARV